VLPALLVPVDRSMSPLTPATPALAVEMSRMPLELPALKPLRRRIDPPRPLRA
jgi:hypothetical protein